MGDVRSSDVDRGWAWVALTASVLTMSILAVFDTSNGIFQAELLQIFSGSQSLVALIFSLALGGRFLIGPVSGVISDLVTHRVAIIIGGALMAVGMVAASLSNDLISILFFLGIGSGTGSGLSFTASVTVVSNYFRKYRTVAFGISLAAPGIGLICGPYLLRWLITDYGWRFAMGCLSCVLAQICVLGSLYFKDDSCFTCCSDNNRPQAYREAAQSVSTDNNSPEDSELKNNQKRCLGEELELKNSAKDSYREEESELKDSLKEYNGDNSKNSDQDSKLMEEESAVSWHEERGTVLSKDSARSADKNDTRVISGNSEAKNVKERITPQDFRNRIKELLCQKFLWVICLNQMMMTAGFANSFNFFPAYVLSVGVPFVDLPTLYTVYGLSLMVTRVAGGFIFNRRPNHLLKALFLVQLGFALVQGFLPLYGVSFQALLLERFLTGMMYGGSLLVVTPILVRSFGAKNLPVAFGIIMLCSGVGSVAAPPIAGVLYDIYGTYNVCCYLSGTAAGISALSLLFGLCTKKSGPASRD